MDTHLFQPDDPHLDELLDRVLATPPMRASLVDDIVAATAPMLAARTGPLDAALAPDAPADPLVERILKATAPTLYRKRHPVIGFLGYSTAYRVAAGVLLAAMVGIWATLASIVADARHLTRIEHQLSSLSTLAAADASLDDEIGRLNEQLHNLQVSTAWDPASMVRDDDTRWPVDGPVTDMPWLF